MGTNRDELRPARELSDCPFLGRGGSVRSTACGIQSDVTAGVPSRCHTDDYDSCPNFLVSLLAKSRSSHRRHDLGFDAK